MTKYRSQSAPEKRPLVRCGSPVLQGGRVLAVAMWIVAFLAVSASSSATTQQQSRKTRTDKSTNPIAIEARELSVHEVAHCHLVSHHREMLLEEGYGSGTLSGKLVMHITLAYTQGSVIFTAYPPGGTITGRGEGSSYARGNTAYFTGTASITSGTGRYAHASARGVKIRGTLQRKTFAFFVEVNARLRY
jgi:hypothetical protein